MACSLRMAARSLRLRLRGCGARRGAVTRLVMGRTRSVVLQQRHERHTTKLGPKFEGPMEVTEVLPNDRYKLKHVNLRGCSEKIASHDFLRPAPLAQSDPFNINDSEEEEQSVWADTNDGEMPANQSASTSGSILNNGP
ncbi:hypothetical protein JYU34_010267 [Plutella xylostella]|uniref:Uncharacterized protein n=1 Tax=Plutella xylostella TaxID=51655 RepID=A0ABQ7QJB5_PLUXY|nr:hypothetical protein JYU34_010267 [Plutella xylostella]